MKNIGTICPCGRVYFHGGTECARCQSRPRVKRSASWLSFVLAVMAAALIVGLSSMYRTRTQDPKGWESLWSPIPEAR